MSVPIQNTVFNYVANGATTSFAYECYVIAASDLSVYLDDVLQPSGYTVTGVGNLSGGDVVFSVAPASGVRVRVERDVDIKRDTQYQILGDFRSPTVNNDFDRLWMVLQRIAYFLGMNPGQFARVLMLGPGDVDGQGAYRARQNRIQDLRDPVNAQDAVNLQTLLQKIAEFSTDGTGQAVLQLLADTTGAANGDARIGVRQPYAGAAGRTQHSKNAEWVSVMDFEGVVGDGVNDDTAGIRAAIATGKSVFFPQPVGFYNISDEIGPKFPGQVLYSNCRKRGMIRNVTNDKPLAYFGDASRADGQAPQAGMRGLTFFGNPATKRGIVLSTPNENGAAWSDACKDCLLEDVAVDFVGDGWALECYSWSNDIRNFTAYEGNKRGALFAVDANSNSVMGLYLTGCAEQSLQIGAHPTSTRINRGNTFLGVVAQQSGGAEGVVVIADADNTTINGLYSEQNNTKGAPRVIYVKDTARGTVINGISHLSGGAIVYRNEGHGSVVSGVVSSNITGAIITNAGSGSLVATGIEWMAGVTPSGAKFSDASSSGTGLHIEGEGLGDTTITSFAPVLRFIDQSAGVQKIRFRYDQGIMRLEYDGAGDGAYSTLLWAFNATVPEFIVDGILRPNTDNTRNLGSASRRWATIYAGTGTINTSDERRKQQIAPIPEEVLRAWGRVQYRQFKFNDAVQAKGDHAARLHVGLVAQRVKEAFEAEGVDPFAYGILCYDEWPDEFEAIRDPEGNETGEQRLVIAAGSQLAIRYEEALALECAYIRWRVDQLQGSGEVPA